MNWGKALTTPGFGIEDGPRLDPNIDDAKLEMLHTQMPDILFQLNRLALPRIGSLEPIDELTYEVSRRPLSIHMKERVRLGTLPRSKLPDTTFDSSSYFNALSELHIEHLSHQRNDAVDSMDCRCKYVARQLFRRLARGRRLHRV